MALDSLADEELAERGADQLGTFVFKPAIGTRGDGVELLSESDSSDVASLLEQLRGRDMLVQPFLRRVRHLGEVCVCFVNGLLLHAIRKNPMGWGGVCENSAGRAAGSTPKTTTGPATRGIAEPLMPVPPNYMLNHPPSEPPPPPKRHVSIEQPVDLLQPVPMDVMNVAHQALDYVQRRFVTRSCQAGTILLARVDLLPSAHGWLISELELGWCDLFLRVRPDVANYVAEEIIRHLPA